MGTLTKAQQDAVTDLYNNGLQSVYGYYFTAFPDTVDTVKRMLHDDEDEVCAVIVVAICERLSEIAYVPKKLLAFCAKRVLDRLTDEIRRAARHDLNMTITERVAEWMHYEPPDELGARETIAAGLESLEDNEQRVIELRFGLDGNGERTVEQIASHLDRSQQWVRGHLREAFRKLCSACTTDPDDDG